jgi:CRISPR-associated protein Csm1
MSVQIFLQGQLQGIEGFLASPAHPNDLPDAGPNGERLLVGRSRWVSLLSEILPRALLEELELAKVLLGSSGGGQFLVVLPGDYQSQAEGFLAAAAEGIERLSGGLVSLNWSSTENLGDWSVVRRRLSETSDGRRLHPAADAAPELFEPFAPAEPADSEGFFSRAMTLGLQEVRTVGWSPETPARALIEGGKYSWPLEDSSDAIALARHVAGSEESSEPASPAELALRAEGRKAWGVLRGDVDNFDYRFRRIQTIEEHVQLSLLYKRFFAGELVVLCSMPEFWQKVTIMYSGGNDFAVFGAWDALVMLAREVQRLFHRFSEENLKDIPGVEGKTISMGLTMATERETPLADAFREAGRSLGLAKSSGRDCFHVFGHTVEWRQLAQAAELHDSLGRLVKDFGGSPHLLGDLIRFYKGTGTAAGGRFDRPWRYHRRLSLVASGARDREYQKLRSKLVADLIGRGAAMARLRPGGRVALEWARLMAEG